MERAKASMGILRWDEGRRDGSDGAAKLARASVVTAYRGDIAGEGTLELVLTYRDDGTASYVGLEQVTGELGGRAGSFVLQHAGVFQDGVATTTWHVVHGSGTGGLCGLRGEGGYIADAGAHVPAVTLDYEIC